MSTDLSEVGRLTRVLVKHAREAFVSQDVIDRQWKALNFTAPPDFSRALDEYDAFLEIIRTPAPKSPRCRATSVSRSIRSTHEMRR